MVSTRVIYSSVVGSVLVLAGLTTLAGCGLFVLFSPTSEQAAGDEAFIDVSDRLGEAREVMGWGGLAAFDYDNDGDIDLLVLNGPGAPNRLFENDGQANFTEVAAQAGVDMPDENCSACTVGDMNNDGRLDLLIARQRMGRPEGADGSTMILLNGGPDAGGVVRFSSASAEQTGLTSEVAAMAVGVGDLDNDGLLDVIIGRYDMTETEGRAPIHTSQPNEMWRCTGVVGGIPHYVQVTGVGIEGTEHHGLTPETEDQTFVPGTLVLYLTDYNGDGWLDYFDLHDAPGGIDLYRNNGNMTFTKVQMDLLNKHGGWMGMAGGDYDRDGDIDYFATNLGSAAVFFPFNPPYIVNTPLLPTGTPFHYLLRNDGGTLADVSADTPVAPSVVLPPLNRWAQSGLKGLEFGFGVVWVDADNRGLLDLYWIGDLSAGDLPFGLRIDYHGVGRFLENGGDGTFADKTAERGLFNIPPEKRLAAGQNDFGRAVAVCDLNGDGYRDLVITNATMMGSSPAYARVLLNPAMAGNHWLGVRLRGTASNRFGIGALVRATAGGTMQVAEVVSTSGAFTGIQPEAHFGLGASTTVETLEVRWPSGAITTLRDVPVDQVLAVDESL